MWHMPKQIPGKSSVAVQNMAGAGGIQATNYMYNFSPRTGQALQADLNRVLPKAGKVAARIKRVLKLK
jgi:hypothetical protein